MKKAHTVDGVILFNSLYRIRTGNDGCSALAKYKVLLIFFSFSTLAIGTFVSSSYCNEHASRLSVTKLN